jgi:uncharacterized protein (TIGR03084 family)
MEDLLADLVAERADLRSMLSRVPNDAFDLMTPAEPWLVRDQISHLAFYDEAATKAATSDESFSEGVSLMAELGAEAYMHQHIARGREMEPAELMAWLADAESDMLAALARRDPDDRLPWYGPPMRASSFVIARLMETWAHGQDVADALGVSRSPTAPSWGSRPSGSAIGIAAWRSRTAGYGWRSGGRAGRFGCGTTSSTTR